jgi:hypothetical protein
MHEKKNVRENKPIKEKIKTRRKTCKKRGPRTIRGFSHIVKFKESPKKNPP